MDFVTFFETLTPAVQIVFLLCILVLIVGSVVIMLVAAYSRGATRNMVTLISTAVSCLNRSRTSTDAPPNLIAERPLPQTDMLE